MANRNTPTQYLLEVLEGPAAGATIPLEGRELPFRAGAGGSISYGRTQRTKLTWYPGNPTASQQIIGRVLKSTTINGVWQDRYLGDDRSIDLVELFEELCDNGVQVRVSWSTIVRQGVVKDVDMQPGTPTGGLGDIGWTIIFEWNSEGQTPVRTVNQGVGTLRDNLVGCASAIGGLGNAVGDFISSVGNFVGSAVTGFAAAKTALNVAVDALSAPLTSIADAASKMGTEPVLPARLVNGTAAATADAQLTAAQIASTSAGVFPGTTTVDDSVETLLDEAIRRYDIIEASFTALALLSKQQIALENIARPLAFTVIPAVIGSDLRAIAIQFYGNADLWDRIAQANGFEGSIVPTFASEVIVPLTIPDALSPSVGGTGTLNPTSTAAAAGLIG